MPKTILNTDNSFVTFYNIANDQGADYFITDTECGIQKDFCYPTYSESDIQFQTNIISSEVLTSSNIIVQQVPSSGTGINLTGVIFDIEQVGLSGGSTPIYNVYLSFISSDLMQNLTDGDCFQIGLIVGDVDITYFLSNQCFKKITDKCLTTKVKYINNEDAFGFYYRSFGTVPFISLTTNTIRLPIYLKEPTVNSNKNIYVKSDGTRKLLSARLSKSYKGFIDSVTEEVHQKLVVALNHDAVYLYPEDYPGVDGIQVTFEDEYNNEFPTIMQNVNVWPADFTIFETPFNNFNSNCG